MMIEINITFKTDSVKNQTYANSRGCIIKGGTFSVDYDRVSSLLHRVFLLVSTGDSL